MWVSNCFISYLERGNLWTREHPLVLDDLIDEAVAEGLVGGHVEVSVGVDTELVHRLAGEGRQIGVEDLLCV